MKNTTLLDDEPFFHLQLKYKGDSLVSHRLMPHVVLASKSPRRKSCLVYSHMLHQLYYMAGRL